MKRHFPKFEIQRAKKYKEILSTSHQRNAHKTYSEVTGLRVTTLKEKLSKYLPSKISQTN